MRKSCATVPKAKASLDSNDRIGCGHYDKGDDSGTTAKLEWFCYLKLVVGAGPGGSARTRKGTRQRRARGDAREMNRVARSRILGGNSVPAV